MHANLIFLALGIGVIAGLRAMTAPGVGLSPRICIGSTWELSPCIHGYDGRRHCFFAARVGRTGK